MPTALSHPRPRAEVAPVYKKMEGLASDLAFHLLGDFADAVVHHLHRRLKRVKGVNLGAFGIDNFIPIVVPGQCSILGIGQITDTCVPDNGNILVRKLMNMTLSVDHKVANGAYAAQFLDFVRKQLENSDF